MFENTLFTINGFAIVSDVITISLLIPSEDSIPYFDGSGVSHMLKYVRCDNEQKPKYSSV